MQPQHRCPEMPCNPASAGLFFVYRRPRAGQNGGDTGDPAAAHTAIA
jgi:hypothetical protein